MREKEDQRKDLALSIMSEGNLRHACKAGLDDDPKGCWHALHTWATYVLT